jgi:hypothetical protein
MINHEELHDGVYYYKNVIKDPYALVAAIEDTENVD